MSENHTDALEAPTEYLLELSVYEERYGKADPSQIVTESFRGKTVTGVRIVKEEDRGLYTRRKVQNRTVSSKQQLTDGVSIRENQDKNLLDSTLTQLMRLDDGEDVPAPIRVQAIGSTATATPSATLVLTGGGGNGSARVDANKGNSSSKPRGSAAALTLAPHAASDENEELEGQDLMGGLFSSCAASGALRGTATSSNGGGGGPSKPKAKPKPKANAGNQAGTTSSSAAGGADGDGSGPGKRKILVCIIGLLSTLLQYCGLL